jgi:hypothetical protein
MSLQHRAKLARLWALFVRTWKEVRKFLTSKPEPAVRERVHHGASSGARCG